MAACTAGTTSSLTRGRGWTPSRSSSSVPICSRASSQLYVAVSQLVPAIRLEAQSALGMATNATGKQPYNIPAGSLLAMAGLGSAVSAEGRG